MKILRILNETVNEVDGRFLFGRHFIKILLISIVKFPLHVLEPEILFERGGITIFISSPLAPSGWRAPPSSGLKTAVCTEPPRLQGTEITVTEETKRCHQGICETIVKRHRREGTSV